MMCRFCEIELEAETHGGTQMCDNCWEVHSRIERMPYHVFMRVIKSAWPKWKDGQPMFSLNTHHE